MSLVEAEDLHRAFIREDGTRVPAVQGVSFRLEQGAALAVIGESGSGKSTLGRIVLGLLRPDRGTIRIAGQDVSALDAAGMKRLRAKVSVVFQEPYESLNPRLRVGAIVAEPLVIHDGGLGRAERAARVAEALREVDLDPSFATRYPHELSGGQQQRVGIARALIGAPDLIVLDEPTSSLDLSVRAQILLLLSRIRRNRGLAFLLITHDVASVEYFADEVAVMQAGRFVEQGPTAQTLGAPRHPYTRELLAARLSVTPPAAPRRAAG